MEDVKKVKTKQVKKVHEHLNNLKGFIVGQDVLDILQGTGFENIMCLADLGRLNSCFDLVSYLASIYDVNSMCFEFSTDVKLYLSLQDILVIWGLPIIGLPFIMVEDKANHIIRRLFPNSASNPLCTENLKKAATDRSNDLHHRVRATIMLFLRSIIAPNSDTTVSGYYGAFLEDISQIKDYAWGELLLVSVHEGLQKFKTGTSQGITGSVFTVMIFMILHVKPLRRMYGIKEYFTPNAWPVVRDVAMIVRQALASSSKKPKLKTIQKTMATCTIDDIIWRPYSTVAIPSSYERQMVMSLAILPMFKNEICVFHTPYHAPRQFDISQQQVREMKKCLKGMIRSDIYISIKGMRGPGKKNYFKLWKGKLKKSVGEMRSSVLVQNWVNLSDNLRVRIQELANKYEELSLHAQDNEDALRAILENAENCDNARGYDTHERGIDEASRRSEPQSVEPDDTYASPSISHNLHIASSIEPPPLKRKHTTLDAFNAYTKPLNTSDDIRSLSSPRDNSVRSEDGRDENMVQTSFMERNKDNLGKEKEMHSDNLILKEREPIQENFEEEEEHTSNQCIHEMRMPTPGNDKLIILDINGVLAHIVDKRECQLQSKNSSLQLNKHQLAFLRPFCKEFLTFCFQNFKVALWTSRQCHNLELFCDKFLLEFKSKFYFLMSQTECAEVGKIPTKNGQTKPVFVKEIGLVWRKYPEFNISNTLLVDDSPYKGSFNLEGSSIFPEGYDYRNKADNALGSGGTIRAYFENLLKAEHVAEFVKKNPFGQSRMSENDPFWYNVRKNNNM